LVLGAAATGVGPAGFDVTGDAVAVVLVGPVTIGIAVLATRCAVWATAGLETVAGAAGRTAAAIRIGRSRLTLAVSTLDCGPGFSETSKDPLKATSAAVIKNAHATAPTSEIATPKPEISDLTLRMADHGRAGWAS
jgi:hypothetical protein